MNKYIECRAYRQGKIRIVVLILVVLMLKPAVSTAQDVPAFVYYNNLSAQAGFPKELQSKRSVVVMDVGDDWRELSEEVHEKLRLMSVDAVQYIDYRDLVAGEDATKAILEYLDKRDISFILTFGRNDQNQYELNITEMKDFLKPGPQLSYRYSNVKIDGLLKFMANELIKADLQKSNFLIAEGPEFLEDAAAIEGRKFEVHARDLATLKLAVPKFSKVSIEAVNSTVNKAAIEDYNRKVDNWNIELEAILKAEFPYKFELVETTDAAALYKDGSQYALFSFHTKGVTIKKMLNMKTGDAETAYITTTANGELKRQSVTKPVWKFYVKHLYTNDIYTGDKWDADETWQQSLRNYLFHYRRFVGV